MARGWESKSVEAQQSEALQEGPQSAPPLTADQKTNLHKKQGLLLDRKRVTQQLENARNPQYRAMLESALAELDRRIAQLN